MSELEVIRNKVASLYKSNPNIHMDVSVTSPKIDLKNAEAEIIEVYPHIFKIRETLSGYQRNHTIQYNDILIKHIRILELQ